MGKRNVNITLQERHINWILTCPDPTPLAFFQCIFPTHRNKASEKYHKILDLALGETNNQEILNKLKEMKKMVDEKKMLGDWESWLQQKAAIRVRRNVRNTNLNLHQEINTLSLNKDESLVKNTNLDISEEEDQEDQEDQEEEEIEEFCINKGNGDSDNNFIERIEEIQPTIRRSWVLNSGTNVEDELAKYVKAIPEAHKCLNLAYWNILDF